ncbi:MAG: type I-B CRISPR-associated protein Cas8b1/Cst1 [Anaerolineae bacterium]|nr:type I-B CRISPR-associated protein Cas8b1/Cst1 [Anaerolineae bacterium]
MLQYTGHVFVDVGVAALTAFARHTDPAQVTAGDLERAADFLERLYTAPGPMRNFARGSVFHNAGYTSSPDPARQQAHADRVLRSWRPGVPILQDCRCVFCGQAAAYRATRQEVPLLNGLDTYNFGPAGRAGIPVCGVCSLAIQALPLGCVKSAGGLVAAHSNDPQVTFRLAKAALERLLKHFSLETNDLPGGPFPQTRFVEMVIGWLVEAERGCMSPASLTGYFFSNSGASPSITIYPLSSEVVAFLDEAHHNADGSLTDAWNIAIARAWFDPKKGKGEVDTNSEKNALYETLLDLPAKARLVLRQHLLPTRHWGLVSLFLTKVMAMDPERIVLLRSLGERFAAYVREKKAFFYKFSRTDEFSRWRRLVLRAADDHMRATGTSLITFDEFAAVFTAPAGEINDWRLARDLVTLALIDARAASGATPDDDEPLFDEEEIE